MVKISGWTPDIRIFYEICQDHGKCHPKACDTQVCTVKIGYTHKTAQHHGDDTRNRIAHTDEFSQAG